MVITEERRLELYTAPKLQFRPGNGPGTQTQRCTNFVIEIASVPAIASFSALALSFSSSYVLISTLGGSLATYLRSSQKNQSSIPFEPGRFLQQEAQYIGRHLRRHGTAALIFCASFASLLALGRQDWWPQLPVWAWWTLSGTILIFFAYAQFRFIRLALYRHKLNSLRDDHLIVADHLNVARARGNHVFHSIPMREGVIDHVVIGSKGIFAIQIIHPPSKKFTSVRPEGDMLVYSPHDPEKGYKKLTQYTRPIAFLKKRLSETLGHNVQVTPVIVVTDCEIESSPGKACLLTTPGRCIMFVGWNNPDAHIMKDEVTAVSKWLISRCRAQPFRKWRARVNSGDIGYST
jgi:hypothetical protein